MRHRSMAALAGLIPLAVLAACSTASRGDAGAYTPPPAFVLSLSPAGDGHDTIPVRINGKGPFPFILDSGADGSAVYSWFAQDAALPLKDGTDAQLSGQTGSSKVSVYTLGTVSMADLTSHGIEAYGLPNRRDKGREAGVIGNDVMDDALVAFDFPCKQIEVYPKPADTEAIIGGTAEPIHTGQLQGTTLLTLPVTINGVTDTAIIDTGSRRTRLNSIFAKRAGIDVASPDFHVDETIYGTSLNPVVPHTGLIGRVGFAGETLSSVTAQVVDLPVLTQAFGEHPAMLLGADLLAHFRFIYDHVNRAIWLRPSRCAVK